MTQRLSPAEDAKARETSSALVWLPRIVDLPSVPRTEVVPLDRMVAMGWIEGEGANPVSFFKAVAGAAAKIGYPVFVRTDFASAKHSGPKAYRADDAAEIPDVVLQTIEDSEMKCFPVGTYRAILVREFLDLDAPFEAFSGHPIAREWRFFTKGGKVACRHFYWPEGAIQFSRGTAEPPSWRGALAILRSPNEVPFPDLDKITEEVVRRLPEADWSVDFARGRDGKWWLIDLAVAAVSWHPKDCPEMAGVPA